MAVERDNGAFPMKQANALVADLMKPNPKIYWPDFLISVSIGWAAFTLAVLYPLNTFIGIIGVIVATLALYRAALFTHELAHLKTGTFGAFRLVWNVLCGFALLIPSFTYHGVHRHHHVHTVYGTREDGEYLPFGAGNPIGMVGYMMLIFVLPAFFIARFMVLFPLSLVFPPLRSMVWAQFSSLTIDLTYLRALPGKNDPKSLWLGQEFMAFVYGWAAVGLVWLDILPLKALALWYGVAVLIFALNSLRTLAAHAYRNPGAEQLTIAEQFLDSVNVPGHKVFTNIWAPTGLRYHATHHLFPRMPYHNLHIAHQRLVEGLPDNSLYLRASRKSLLDALIRIWQDASAGEAQKHNHVAAE